MLDLEAIRGAAKRIDGVAHRTPVLTSSTLDQRTGTTAFLKAENFQRVGAFKFRGAYNTIAQLTPAQLGTGVAAYSSGNHAQAVALAAKLLGTKAVILMPEDTPPSKVDATRGYGAEVITYDRYTGDRVALGKQLAEDRALTLIPPYDHLQVMAGQGTVALELLEETGPLHALVIPMGGGGLMAGCATATKGLHPNTRVIGVEPEQANDTQLSLRRNERVRIPVPRTIADGQATDIPGELTFSVNQRLVDDIILVSDDEIREAMRFAFERLKIVLEPSGATSLAALLKGDLSGRVGVVLSGGNISAERFLDLLA